MCGGVSTNASTSPISLGTRDSRYAALPGLIILITVEKTLKWVKSYLYKLPLNAVVYNLTRSPWKLLPCLQVDGWHPTGWGSRTMQSHQYGPGSSEIMVTSEPTTWISMIPSALSSGFQVWASRSWRRNGFTEFLWTVHPCFCLTEHALTLHRFYWGKKCTYNYISTSLQPTFPTGFSQPTLAPSWCRSDLATTSNLSLAQAMVDPKTMAI